MRALVALLLFAGAADGAKASAPVASEGPEKIAVTVYRDGLALISETRRVSLPEGRSTIEFRGVSDRMIPQSAILEEFGAVSIERNFDFDLLSPASFFSSAEGEEVILTRTNRATGRATRIAARVVSSAPGQGVVLKTPDGFEAYQCAGLSESISAAGAPPSLKPRPTLSIEVSADKPTEETLTISYLASGYSWNADYILTLGEGKSADIAGWLTLQNGTSVPVTQAETAIVAGALNVLGDTAAPESVAPYFVARCWPRGSTKRGVSRAEAYAPPPGSVRTRQMMARAAAAPESAADEAIVVTGARIAAREDLGDYKLYRTPEPTTLAAMQTKQVAFLSKPGIAVDKVYLYETPTPEFLEGEAVPATVEYRIDNSRKGALAEPLPRGTVRVMSRTAAGGMFFVGEASVMDMAVDAPAKVRAADAFDVMARTTIVSRKERWAGNLLRREMSVEHVFTNASPEDATVELVLGANTRHAVAIDRANKPRARGAALPTFRIRIPANGSETLAYRARWTED